ncbi:MAG: class II fructose-1,6-bisphosphate aldolase [Lachnospiraceae bacterium]|nr:class II fructose-1,6-bisphosphate aldolase [Lachnospiraceae bacterium]
MGLVNAKEMLAKAKAGHYAVGHFNLNNMESVRAFLLAAEETRSPIILGVSGGTAKYMGGYKTIAHMVEDFMEFLKITVPVALHVDHGTYEEALAAIEGGFSSIMFDGSKYGIEENVEKTKYIVSLCKEKGITVEAEVGAIGGEEDGRMAMGECADPNECAAIAALGIDMLAAGIGNIHGKYPADWKGLNFDVLAAIQDKTDGIPLVLHGGSGIPDDMIKQAIDLGVCKINVNTECQIAFTEATRKYIEEGKDLKGKGFTPRALLAPGLEATKQKCIEKMALFGSLGKA